MARGSSLRWLGDQKGESIYGRLVQTSRTGVANVEDKANETFANLFGDFATAVYTDSVPGVPRASIPPRLRLTSRNLRQIFRRFSDIDRTGRTPAFPFTPTRLAAGGRANGTVVPGAMMYYQLIDAPNEPSLASSLGSCAGRPTGFRRSRLTNASADRHFPSAMTDPGKPPTPASGDGLLRA